MDITPSLFNYGYSKVTGQVMPSMYPGEKSDNWQIPNDIQQDFHRLNSLIESKYGREFLKVCAFYNKMFPSLRAASWSRSSYNVQPFTYLDQERSDTGTGTSSNYLKQVIDQLTSRLGTITFQPKITQEEPTLGYVVYKDEAERILRKILRNKDFNRTNTEVFHDAAVLGYSHVFIDPYTGSPVKANDFETGMYEAEMNKGVIKHFLYRDYAFPVAELTPYLATADEETRKKVLESCSAKASCDFKLYIDTVLHKTVVVISGTALPEQFYPHENVLVSTFQWDTGFTRVTTTSLFDLLYPIQREINKINAKIQQLIRMYKGPVPVFNSDVDIAMKAISNGSGEALYVDSSRPVEGLMTVINPTPLDAELQAQIDSRKTEMYELAGLQSASFDMENMRSAAAVVALDQTRDSVFQAQLQALARFDREVLIMNIKHLAVTDTESSTIDWQTIVNLVTDANIDLKPVHLNDPLGSDDNGDQDDAPDYIQLQTARLVLDIIKGRINFGSLPYYVDKNQLKVIAATYLIKFSALGLSIPDTLTRFFVDAFVDAIRLGEIQFGTVANPPPPPPEEESATEPAA